MTENSTTNDGEDRARLLAELVAARRDLERIARDAGLAVPEPRAGTEQGYQLVNPGDTIKSEHHNRAMNQAVLTFANAAARNAAITAPLPGMHSYLTDTRERHVYHGGWQTDRSVPIAAVVPYAGGSAPAGWLLCNGAAVSRATYAALFAVIGTTYGGGDGTSTFQVPALLGRLPIGIDPGQPEFNVLGMADGVKGHIHTLENAAAAIMASGAGQIPLRYKSVAFNANQRVNGVSVQAATGVSTEATEVFGTTDSTGSLPPYLVVNYLIRAL